MKLSYLRKYVPYIQSLKAENKINYHENLDEEKMFTLWFQGIETAPHVVKQCVESIKEFYGERLVILDDSSVWDYISLPEYVIEKRNKKIMGPANFSDIVRLELLYKYGGYWFDATDFMMRPVPDIIKDSDFFMYVSSETLNPHMFVANCFIRAKKGDPLLKMWRDLVLEYWKNEHKNVDYFLVHYLLRLLVTYNPEAKALFEKMPKIQQDALHLLWFKYGDKPFESHYYDEIKNEIFIQKLSYRKLKFAKTEIQPGTTKDYIINKKLNEDK
ncbi:MAG: hypothetical protein J1E16_01640 [Muribaculaceae bacterium]|nr:hypothetical protein [Muribaculaceae bacterium]